MNHHDKVCGFCRAMGTYLPWAFLVAGGLASVAPIPASWNESAAYMVALGLAILTGSYILRRLTHTGAHG